MRASFVSATLMFVLAVAATPIPRAGAADLDGEEYGAPYDDPGYADEGYAPEDGPPPSPRRYGEVPPDDYGAPDDEGSLPGSVKDGYPVPVPPSGARGDRGWDRAEHYDPPPPPRGRAGPRFACLDTWQIRRRLRGEGWTDIRPMGGNGRVVHVRARRYDSSSLFRLRVERCTGDVLAARPHYLRSFAYGERPWRR